LAGAKQVIVPSNENFLNLPDFDPMHGTSQIGIPIKEGEAK
jgi:hypothetical protein